MRIASFIIPCLFAICLFSCSRLHERKFDKDLWMNCDQMEFSPRNEMYKDLISNYRINGQSYQEILLLLGKPFNAATRDSNKIYYPSLVKYGTIDPIHAIYLELSLNKDSECTAYQINEWEKSWR